jgi:hypothetical protein
MILPSYSRLALLAFFSILPVAYGQEAQTPIRAGMIGLDTSHVPAFVNIFNGPKATGDVVGIKVVAGYPGGTDLPASKDRVAKFTETIRAKGV